MCQSSSFLGSESCTLDVRGKKGQREISFTLFYMLRRKRGGDTEAACQRGLLVLKPQHSSVS